MIDIDNFDIIFIETTEQYESIFKDLYLQIKDKYNHDDMLSNYRYEDDIDIYIKSLVFKGYIMKLEIGDVIRLRNKYKDFFSTSVIEAAMRLYKSRHLIIKNNEAV